MGKENIYNKLLNAIENPYGVCGLMGNIQAESNFRSNNMQNGYEARLGFNDETYTQAVDNGSYTNFAVDRVGYGLCQWTSSGRKAGFLGFANSKGKSIGDEDMQIEYIMYELTTAYKKVLEVLKGATSVKEASDYVCTKYERPADQSEKALAKRASYGETIYKEFVKEEVKEETPYKVGNSPLITYGKLSPNKNSPRNHVIDTITIHCFVGQVTAEEGCNLKKFTTYNPVSGSSCNYVVGCDGSIGLCVEEKDRSWCSNSRSNDHRSVTIEVASDTVHPYAVTDKAMESLIELCADICKRNNIEKLVWSTEKNERVNHLNGCNMTVHRDFAAKSCPGDYLYNQHSYIAEEVNKRLGVVVEKEKTKKYRVQIGCFSVYKNAENLKKELEQKGYKAIIKETTE